MQPIKEYGGYAYYMRMYDKTGARPEVARALGNTHVGDGARFCGRGYVQLTGRANYEKAAAMLGVDFVGIPELAMEPGNAALILLLGMREGWFTGRTLSDYLARSKSDWEGARRIVNGLDKASTIASYAKAFHAALLAAEAAPSDHGTGSAEPDKPPDPIVHSQTTEQPPSGGFFHALIRLLCRFFGRR